MNKTEIAYMGQKRPSICALLSLGNALLHHGIIDAPWDQESQEFEALVVDAGATAGSAIESKLDDIAERYVGDDRWPRLRVDKYVALEISKELVVKLLEKGAVIALPVWVEKVGLHSILIVDSAKGPAGHWFTAINREPFTSNPVKNQYDWEVLGFRRWNVPVRVYWRAA
jgi:hypothetical protein